MQYHISIILPEIHQGEMGLATFKHIVEHFHVGVTASVQHVPLPEVSVCRVEDSFPLSLVFQRASSLKELPDFQGVTARQATYVLVAVTETTNFR